MALNKTIILDNGIPLTYHRVISVANITNQNSVIEVGSYLNKEQRDKEKQWYENSLGDMNVFINTMYFNKEYDKDLNVDNAYEYLKTTETFKDATDIFEEEEAPIEEETIEEMPVENETTEELPVEEEITEEVIDEEETNIEGGI